MVANIPPQVAILSSRSDQERIDPFVRGLQSRGLQVWWDSDSLLAGEKFEQETERIIETTPIVCVIVSERSVRSASFSKFVELASMLKTQIVPVRIDEVMGDTLPPAIRRWQWVDILTPSDIDQACDRILRLVETQEKRDPSVANQRAEPPSSRPSKAASANMPSSAAAKQVEGLELLLGDAVTPEIWPMTDQLRLMLEQAARYRRDAADERSFALSFRTTMMAIFYAAGAWSQWAIQLANSTGFDYQSLGTLPVSTPSIPTPLRATSSIATLLQTAREYARQSHANLDVHHVIAAAIFMPNWHAADLSRMDKPAWANALIRETQPRFPADAAIFASLRDSLFPAAPASHVGNFRGAADPELQRALDRAAQLAAARSKDSPAFTVTELFAGILRESLEFPFADRVASLVPNLTREGDEPVWAVLLRMLGLPRYPDAPTQTASISNADAGQVLTMAQAMRAGSALSCTHVFLAMFKPEKPGESAAADSLLKGLGVDADVLLETLLKEFEEHRRTGGEDLPEILGLRRNYRWERPHVDNDFVEGAIPPDRDLLDARKPALRFAKLLAARDVQPPIALGLFGNWGSGKTFFMGLMRDRIADLSKNGGNGYVRRVVQIEFNAWHYHDTNLWASLAMRIFEGLAKELGGKVPSEVEKKRKELHQKIRSSASRREEAVDVRDKALGRRTTAVKALEALNAQREKKRTQSVLHHLNLAWVAVQKKAPYGRLKEAANALTKNFGIDAAVESAADVRKLQKDVEDTRAHALGIFTAIGRRFHGMSASAATAAVLTIVVLTAVALGWGVEWLDRLKQLNLPRFSGTLIQIAAMVSAVAAWCGCRVQELRGVLDTIDAVEADLVEAEKDVMPDEPLKKLQAEIAELDKKIHRQNEAVTAAEREIAEATAEIDRINRGGLVYDFLQERTTAASYTGQLGLISTIRQDLERLDGLLQDFVEKGKDPIERIVLYIDDLDRCHPNKVVEVLQAVHLLLAFDLFNVVVGVDARWLERSLYRQYVGDSRDGLPAPNDPFSPQDYLEKIFQIPYALAPMDKDYFKNLMGGIVETRTEWREKEREKQQKQILEAEAAAKAKQAQTESANKDPEVTSEKNVKSA